MKVHYTFPYLLNPQHKVTVNLVGLGGTGSQALTGLVRLNEALLGLGHPGLHVRSWDHDHVSDANIGRQLFSPADVGHNKAVVLVSRINRFFGYDWEAHPLEFDGTEPANITVTCIDSAAGRIAINKNLVKDYRRTGEPHEYPVYWLDMGNLQKTGQVVLGTLVKVDQPKSEQKTAGVLPTVVKMFPSLRKVKDDDQGPSCSLAQALRKQDLMINPAIATFGIGLLWKLFREGVITHQGCYINLDTCIVNPIPIK